MPCAFAGTAGECVISRRSLESLPLPFIGQDAKRREIFSRLKIAGFQENKKALCYPRAEKLPEELAETIWINGAWWNSQPMRNFQARLFIYFHECAHLEGARCEPCADRRAGEWLKAWGVGSPRTARIAAIDTLENRSSVRAQAEIAEGFGIDLAGAPWFAPQNRGLEHAERLAGVDARLIAFAESAAIVLNKKGVRVVVGLDGGKRTDAAKQLSYFNQGLSEARTLEDTPHGRGAAEDLMLYPPSASAPLPDWHPAWKELGEMARAAGFAWGGDFPKPDRPHIQLKNWRDYLPNFSTSFKLGTGAVIAAIALVVFGKKK